MLIRQTCNRLVVACVCLYGLGFAPAKADDWTQWRGKDRLAVWHEEGIVDEFPEEGLEVVWKRPIGSGYSGPVVSQGRIVTMDYRPKPDTELV